jgi:transcriptional regulator with XRE-family HTH domain
VGIRSALFTHMGHARNRPKRLAEKLLQIREALGLSQREIAERLSERAGVKITSKNISKYERDKSVPFIEVVLAYARLANVEMNQIVDDDLDLPL